MKLTDLLESVQLLSKRYYGRFGGSLGNPEKRDFKRRELEHELAHEDEWNRQQKYQKNPDQKYNIKIDGKLWMKNGKPVEFDNQAHANAVASKPWAKGKKIDLVPVQ